MPTPNASLLVVDLTFRDQPTDTAELFKMKIDNGLNYLGNLGGVVSHLSLEKLMEQVKDASPHQRQELLADFGAAVFVLGQIISGIAETTFDTVDQLLELQSKNKSEARPSVP